MQKNSLKTEEVCTNLIRVKPFPGAQKKTPQVSPPGIRTDTNDRLDGVRSCSGLQQQPLMSSQIGLMIPPRQRSLSLNGRQEPLVTEVKSVVARFWCFFTSGRFATVSMIVAP